MTLRDLDHPLIFAVAVTFVVVAMTYILGWAFTTAGLQGPAQLMKGYGNQ